MADDQTPSRIPADARKSFELAAFAGDDQAKLPTPVLLTKEEPDRDEDAVHCAEAIQGNDRAKKATAHRRSGINIDKVFVKSQTTVSANRPGVFLFLLIKKENGFF